MKVKVFFCLFVFISNSFAQIATWKQTAGPYTGNVKQIAVLPDGHLFLVTEYYSGGSSGLYQSDDYGNSWNYISIPKDRNGFPDYANNLCLSLDSIMYVCSNYDGLLIKSTDLGMGWEKINIPSGPFTIKKIICSSQSDLYVVTYDGHANLFHSTDRGSSWSNYDGPFTDGNKVITSLIADSSKVLILSYISYDSPFIYSPIIQSMDSGKTWYNILTIYAAGIQTLIKGEEKDIFIGTTDGRIIIIKDVGTIWSDIKITDFSITNIIRTENNNFVAGTSGKGIFKSTDNGSNWSNIGLSDKSVNCLASNGTDIFAGLNNDAGFYYLQSDTNWIQLGMPITRTWAVNSDMNGNVFATVDGRGTDGGVYRSSNAGNHWIHVYTNLSSQYIRSLCIDKVGNLYEGTNRGIMKSTDAGESWTQLSISSDWIYSIEINPQQTIFAGGGDSGRVYRSTDEGITWDLIHKNSITSREKGPSSVYSIVSVNNILYAAIINEGVLISTNNGNSWSSIHTPDSTVLSVCVNSKGHILAGTLSNGIFITADDGKNWIQSNNGLTNKEVRKIVVDSLGHLFAGTNGGVFQSNNDGISWTQSQPKNLEDQRILSMAFDHEGYLYAGTAFGSVWRSILPTTLDVKSNAIPVIDDYLLSQNYPNPFNPSTIIEYSVPQTSLISLKVFDILGREVVTLENEEKPSGTYVIEFDGSKLPSGVYFYRIQAGDFIQTKKMILLR